MNRINWIQQFSASEWPGNVTEQMAPSLFHRCLFPLRIACGFPMWPSQFETAHVRDFGGSRHSTNGGARLSDATDQHVSTYGRLVEVFHQAQQIKAIGGIGIYFDTNTPMFHIDERSDRIMWLRVTEVDEDGNNKQRYIYYHHDPIQFYIELGLALSKTRLL